MPNRLMNFLSRHTPGAINPPVPTTNTEASNQWPAPVMRTPAEQLWPTAQQNRDRERVLRQNQAQPAGYVAQAEIQPAERDSPNRNPSLARAPAILTSTTLAPATIFSDENASSPRSRQINASLTLLNTLANSQVGASHITDSTDADAVARHRLRTAHDGLSREAYIAPCSPHSMFTWSPQQRAGSPSRFGSSDSSNEVTPAASSSRRGRGNARGGLRVRNLTRGITLVPARSRVDSAELSASAFPANDSLSPLNLPAPFFSGVHLARRSSRSDTPHRSLTEALAALDTDELNAADTEARDNSPSPRVRAPILPEITLAQLHRRSEAPHRALHIVSANRRPAAEAPVDQETAHLMGRAYLEFLVVDSRPGKRLPSELIALLSGRKFLQSPDRTEENMMKVANKLRPVVAEMYRDPVLSRAIADHAVDTMRRCIDGASFDLRQMQDMALAAKISRGGIDDIALYNHGLSFFMLNEVEKETSREITRHYGAREAREALHAHMYAVFYLQNTFKFPHHQEDPRIPSATFMTREIAQEIGARVCQNAVKDDGASFFDYMSQWDPWIAHSKRQPMYETDFAGNSEDFQNYLAAHEANCAIPDSTEGRMTEQEKIQKSNQIGERYKH